MALAAIVFLTLLFFWKILLTNLILSGVDVFLYFYPYKAYVAEALRQGRLPLWNPLLFMGAPLLANSQVGLFYPPNWLFIWLDPPKQVAWSIGLHIALAGGLMLLFTRQALALSWPASLVAAILFAFGGYLGAQVEHVNQLQAAAWLPLLFLLYDFGLHRQRRWFWFLLLALTIALTLLAGHTQTVFISLFGLGLYGLWQAITEATNRRTPPKARKRKANIANPQSKCERMSEPANPAEGRQAQDKRDDPVTPSSVVRRPSSIYHHSSREATIHFSLLAPRSSLPPPPSSLLALPSSLLRSLWPLAIISVLAVALTAVQLLPTAELSRLSIRSGGLTFRSVVSFSLVPTVLHYSLLPPLGLDLTQILGEAFGEWVAYLGISGLILTLLGVLSALWQPAARRFIFVGGTGLVLSLGLYTGPLYLALYYLVPGFSLFRVPARWLLLYAFGMAVLAGFGFEALRNPAELRQRLTATWQWLRARWWRLALAVAPLFFLLALIVRKTPPAGTLITWLILVVITCYLLYVALTSRSTQPYPERSRRDATRSGLWPVANNQIALGALILLLIVELFWAAQALNYNQPTAPQAYHSMRNAVAYLLATDPPGGDTPPDRFLSLSGITYDPGDLAELERVYGDRLSEKALYNLVVATKEKEVLFFNLPMIYGLHSVDGYDGGILPLSQFVTIQQLFLPADALSLDGRLREKLRFVPPGRLLSLLNTRWIITDKQFDVWIDGIFYDLQFPARLASGQTITTRDVPIFQATTLGLVSHLEGAAEVFADGPVAEVTVISADGSQETFILKAGVDTAEGNYPTEGGAAHPQATIGVVWPYGAQGVDYITIRQLRSDQQIVEISVRGILPDGQFVLRGLSLIHQPTATSRSVLLTTEGDYRQVHSGDVKVYENRAALPRTFIVHQAELVPDDTAAIALMQEPGFDPREKLVRPAKGGETVGVSQRGQPGPAERATIVSYTPERVEIAANFDSPGWLVLSDTHYPGWQATVDGQPVEIVPANILFRAVAVPEGDHTVVFEFKPASLRWGALISGLALLGVVIGLVFSRKS